MMQECHCCGGRGGIAFVAEVWGSVEHGGKWLPLPAWCATTLMLCAKCAGDEFRWVKILRDLDRTPKIDFEAVNREYAKAEAEAAELRKRSGGGI